MWWPCNYAVTNGQTEVTIDGPQRERGFPDRARIGHAEGLPGGSARAPARSSVPSSPPARKCKDERLQRVLLPSRGKTRQQKLNAGTSHGHGSRLPPQHGKTPHHTPKKGSQC